MSRITLLHDLIDQGAVAVLRADQPDHLPHVIEALLAGGLRAMEITMTVPGALKIIAETRKRFGDDVLLGVGSVLDPETARLALLPDQTFGMSYF